MSATDTQPADATEALALLASVASPPGDTTLQDLHATITRILRGKTIALVLEEVQPADVAMLIVSQPIIWSGIVRLQRIAARHQPRRWREDSDTVVCAAGCGSFPCEDAILLGLAPDPDRPEEQPAGRKPAEPSRKDLPDD